MRDTTGFESAAVQNDKPLPKVDEHLPESKQPIKENEPAKNESLTSEPVKDELEPISETSTENNALKKSPSHSEADMADAGNENSNKPPVDVSLDKLTAANDPSTPEILKVRGMKFMYPSGSKPLEGYTLKRGIGIGGFGEVYFALSDAGKEVALKRIQRNLDIELRGVRQCLNLKHVNLISLWDIRTSETGECWVVMEYVPGQSLRDAINACPGGMPMDLVDHWFSATAAGVAYLHERGIVHRDLKPGNIFQDDDEQVVKIGDYGLSKFISTSQRDNQTESVGTFHYMAPEIGKGVYGKEVDIYALGIILHEMVTGQVPFDGESSQEIIMKHLTADPNIDRVPTKLRPVIKRALAKDPDQRYSSVEELISDLDFKNIPNNLHKRAQDLSKSQSRRIPPIKPVMIEDVTIQSSEEPFYIGDEIQFGAMNEVVDAESVVPQPVHVETVEVIVEEAYATHQLDDEPIAKAVKGGWSGFVSWWNNETISTPLKVVIVGVIALALIYNVNNILPIALALALIYLIYYLVRVSFLSSGDKASAQVSAKVPAGTYLSKKQQVELVRGHLGKRTWSDRLTEISGSLIFSAIAAGVFGLLGLAVGGNLSEPNVDTWAFYAWLVVTSIAASWSLLIANKCWEHRTGDAMVRRFTMLSIGVLVGLVSFAFAEAMNLDWSTIGASDLQAGASPLSEATFARDGSPTLMSHLAFFASMFLILRWWKNADSVRRTRFNLISIGLCLIWGVVLGLLFYFPQPWSMVIAVVVAASTQITSPWLHPDKRAEMIYGTAA